MGNSQAPHVRGIRVKCLPPTDTKGLRVKLIDTRLKESVIISYDYECNDSKEVAINYLTRCQITIDSYSCNEVNSEYLLNTLDFETSIKTGKESV